MAQFSVSVPGRTEVAGNHQDHQGGQVIAAAVDRRIECTAQPAEGPLITVRSDEGGSFQLDLEEPDFAASRPDEQGTSRALVRGMAAQLLASGVPVRGCKLDFASDIPLGMGLSSSAAFELCAGAALAAVAGVRISDALGISGAAEAGRPEAVGPHDSGGLSDAVHPVELAKMAMAAERRYFGKPSGLMDQLACALGGVMRIDFAEPRQPAITSLSLPASWDDYAGFLVSCESGHEDATDEYAQVALDMQRVAKLLGVQQLRQLSLPEYLARLQEVRLHAGDRAALRGFHFYNEFDLVSRRVRALQADDMQGFVRLTELSGVSSAEYLQNVSAQGDDQPAMLALAFCRMVLDEAALESSGVHDELPSGHAASDFSGGARASGMRGSARIHGGGFGGTIQVFAPSSHAGYFQERIEQLMGAGCCMPVKLGAPGITVSEE